jgi:hypothetical protein
MITGMIVAAILVLELLALLAAGAGAEYLLFRSLRASWPRAGRQTTGSVHPTPAAALRDPEAAAAIAAAERIVTTAAHPGHRRPGARPRCSSCWLAMDLDASGRFWRCTAPGCQWGLLPVHGWRKPHR